MKKILIISIICLVFSTTSLAQTDTSKKNIPLSAAQYVKKSKSQKTAAFILLGAGAVAFAIVMPGDLSFEASGNLVVAGGLAALGNIPLVIASAKNKRKARKAIVLSAKMESAPALGQRSFFQRSYPSLSISVPFH